MDSNIMTDKTLAELLEMHDKNIALRMHPVGCYYTSDKPTNPGKLFGGIWESVRGVFILAESDAYPAGTVAGEEKVTLTVSEMPEHNHTFMASPYLWNERDGTSNEIISPTAGTAKAVYKTTASVGGSKPHNNMPPFMAVYCWRRVA